MQTSNRSEPDPRELLRRDLRDDAEFVLPLTDIAIRPQGVTEIAPAASAA